MQKLTQEQVQRLLNAPNGSEALMERAEAAFDAAWALYLEGSPQACAFLCRAAKRKEYAARMEAALSDRTPLYAALSSGDAKLRKNTARLMGALKNPADAPALKAALEEEEQRYVRPSILLALGALGEEEALRAYVVPAAMDESQQRHAREEQEALRTALSAFVLPDKHTFTGLTTPHVIEVRTPDRLGEVAAEELTELGFTVDRVRPDRLSVATKDYPGLFQGRCFFEALFPLCECGEDAKTIALRAGPPFLSLLRECCGGEGRFGYRIEIKGEADRGALARGVASVLDGEDLVNSPSNYEAELRLEPGSHGVRVYAKLWCVKDQRFDYRLSSLPASIHPATAAAVLRYASSYLTANARVLDPCCGSGTLLFEREKLSPCASLTGVDIAHKAVDVARQNGAAAGSRAKFIANDNLRFKADRPYDEVIANLPFGNRVGNHKQNEALYAGMLDRLSAWLRPGGTAVLYTMEFTLLKKLLRERPALRLVTETRTEAGGLNPTIFIIQNSR